MIDRDEAIAEVAQWRDATKTLPVLVREDIAKGNYTPAKPTGGFKGMVEDPLEIAYTMGYKDRKHSISYDMARHVVQNLSLLSSIINTRTAQIAAFAQPFRLTDSLGFVIKHKNPGKVATKGDREMIRSMEAFMYNCGSDKANPHNDDDAPRDDFETIIKKLVKDSLTFDQCTIEIVNDRRGLPFEFRAVDASTIRIAAKIANDPESHADSWGYADHRKYLHSSNPYSRINADLRDPSNENPAYVQVINGQLYRAFSRKELAFGVRNPRTDIYVHGYGQSEIEQLITIITAHLYAEEYNRRFFMNASMPKGILAIKGDSMDPDQFEGFKRQWEANVSGTANAFRTPMIQSEAGIDWINMNPSNRDMEYGQWVEYLVKLITGVFLCDPAELNFDLAGGVQQTPLFESSSEWKLKASRDRGLKPLLRFFSKFFNDNIVSRMDDNFIFEFVGLDELTEQEKHELHKEQIASYKTLNEIRRAQDLPDVDHGDMIMNPTYIQAMQVKQQMEQAQQQMDQAAQMDQQPSEEQGDADGDGDQDQDEGIPDYASQFVKSMVQSPQVLEIQMEDYDTWLDVWKD